MSASYKRYYEKNRDAITERMRERARLRRKTERVKALTTKGGVEAQRAEARERYARSVESRITRQLKSIQEDPKSSETMKRFILEVLWPVKHLLPLTFVKVMLELPRESAFKEGVELPPDFVDGGTEDEGEEEDDTAEAEDSASEGNNSGDWPLLYHF